MDTNQMKLLSALTILVMSLVVCSCSLIGARKAVIQADRFSATGIDSTESVVILLNKHSEYGENKTSESSEDTLNSCMLSDMPETPKLKIIATKEFRNHIFPGITLENTPKSSADLLSLFRNDDKRNQVEKLGIRYIINVELITTKTDNEHEFDVGGAASMGVTTRWWRTSTCRADILDLKRLSSSGFVYAYSRGDSGYAIWTVFLIIPMPPIVFFSRTETEACSALGKAVHDFMFSRAEPTLEKQNKDHANKESVVQKQHPADQALE
jgi:hypothetical protein